MSKSLISTVQSNFIDDCIAKLDVCNIRKDPIPIEPELFWQLLWQSNLKDANILIEFLNSERNTLLEGNTKKYILTGRVPHLFFLDQENLLHIDFHGEYTVYDKNLKQLLQVNAQDYIKKNDNTTEKNINVINNIHTKKFHFQRSNERISSYYSFSKNIDIRNDLNLYEEKNKQKNIDVNSINFLIGSNVELNITKKNDTFICKFKNLHFNSNAVYNSFEFDEDLNITKININPSLLKKFDINKNTVVTSYEEIKKTILVHSEIFELMNDSKANFNLSKLEFDSHVNLLKDLISSFNDVKQISIELNKTVFSNEENKLLKLDTVKTILNERKYNENFDYSIFDFCKKNIGVNPFDSLDKQDIHYNMDTDFLNLSHIVSVATLSHIQDKNINPFSDINLEGMMSIENKISLLQEKNADFKFEFTKKTTKNKVKLS